MPPGTGRRSCSTASKTDVPSGSSTGSRRSPVERLQPVGATLPGEGLDTPEPGDDQPVPHTLVAQARVERLGQIILVARAHEQRTITENFGERTCPRGDDGHTVPHGLERWKPEALVQRR